MHLAHSVDPFELLILLMIKHGDSNVEVSIFQNAVSGEKSPHGAPGQPPDETVVQARQRVPAAQVLPDVPCHLPHRVRQPRARQLQLPPGSAVRRLYQRRVLPCHRGWAVSWDEERPVWCHFYHQVHMME